MFVQQGWQGVMIEGDRRRYKSLVKNMWDYRVKPVHAMVKAKELDKHLKRVPKDFDVLSIDIDSFDYWLWYYLEGHSPKIVVIEIDGGYADDEEWVQPEDRAPQIRRLKYNGASRLSMNLLAKKKGYRLVAEPGNQIYLRNDLWK